MRISRFCMIVLPVLASAAPAFAQMDQRTLPQSSATIQPLNSPAEMNYPYNGVQRVQARNRYGDDVSALKNNPVFAAALTKSLSQSGTGLPGTSLRFACDGFATVGSCLATLHAAKMLASPNAFDALRLSMVEGAKLSLGDAIQAYRPDADAKALQKAAEKKARGNCAQVAASGY